MTILIPSKLHDQLVNAAAKRPNEEICGLLFGRYDRVQSLQITRNVAQSPATNFEIAPAALIAAHREARNGGPAILGCFHSHPNGRTSPSPSDEASSAADGSIWLIIARDVITGWRAVSGGFEPLPILQSG